MIRHSVSDKGEQKKCFTRSNFMIFYKSLGFYYNLIWLSEKEIRPFSKKALDNFNKPLTFFNEPSRNFHEVLTFFAHFCGKIKGN
jgi:hypothetical protein